MNLPYFTLNGIIQYEAFTSGFFSPSTFLRFVCTVTFLSSFLSMAGQYSIVLYAPFGLAIHQLMEVWVVSAFQLGYYE